jgi:adenosyl cobinamide kinase/adenosyl cobinamide phosphate guanylyltransferase
MKKMQIFVTGGAYAGKTARACALASEFDQVLWIGTSSETTPELKSHIEAMRSQRPQHWQHVSAPLNLPEILCKYLASPLFEIAVIDSTSQWIANSIAVNDGRYDEAQLQNILTRDCNDLLDAASDFAKHHSLIIVSSDFGASVPPENLPQRLLRKYVGTINQQLAKQSASVEILASGLIIYKK